MYIQTKNTNFGKFLRALVWKRLVNSVAILTTIWCVFWPFGNLVAIGYIFPRFGILDQDKSGNPAAQSEQKVFVTKILDFNFKGQLFFPTEKSKVRMVYVPVDIFSWPLVGSIPARERGL
jgi:hypothetical protein